jgi:tetratricopeptide (TPR) repeat protein
MEQHAPEKKANQWAKGLRPLFLWVLLVCVLFAIHTHERLLATTHIRFSVLLNGRPIDATATLNGQSIGDMELVRLGRKEFSVSHPKAEPFSTNLFIGYGKNDLGRISLKRSTGILNIKANPPATLITIRGPEFSHRLTNTGSMALTVPTDEYVIEATYPHWSGGSKATVSTSGETARFDPPLGALRVECNQADGFCRLLNLNEKSIASGRLPAVFEGLPEGTYQIIASLNGRERIRTVEVRTGKTNEVTVQFIYGAAAFETVPAGVTVLGADGRALGLTPLVVSGLEAGGQNFTLRREGYEPVTAVLQIDGNQTNSLRTNLVSAEYVRAMKAAQEHFESERFDLALQAAERSLVIIPEDPSAIALKRKAFGKENVRLAKIAASQVDYATAVRSLAAVLEISPEDAEAKTLLQQYQKLQQNQEQERIRERAESLAKEERLRRIAGLKESLESASRRYEGADSFPPEELNYAKDVKLVGDGLLRVLRDLPPKFTISRYEWTKNDIFMMESRQNLQDGWRECVVVGGETSNGQAMICFKVIEHQTPHTVNVLGGALTAQLTTDADRNGQRAERFQAQIKEGVKAVRERFQKAIP